jgi:hypothetical protein
VTVIDPYNALVTGLEECMAPGTMQRDFDTVVRLSGARNVSSARVTRNIGYTTDATSLTVSFDSAAWTGNA